MWLLIFATASGQKVEKQATADNQDNCLEPSWIFSSLYLSRQHHHLRNIPHSPVLHQARDRVSSSLPSGGMRSLVGPAVMLTGVAPYRSDNWVVSAWSIWPPDTCQRGVITGLSVLRGIAWSVTLCCQYRTAVWILPQVVQPRHLTGGVSPVSSRPIVNSTPNLSVLRCGLVSNLNHKGLVRPFLHAEWDRHKLLPGHIVRGLEGEHAVQFAIVECRKAKLVNAFVEM